MNGEGPPGLATWADVVQDVPRICHWDGRTYDISRDEARQIYALLREILRRDDMDWHSSHR